MIRRRSHTASSLLALAATLYLGVLRMTVVRAEQPQMPPALANALPADATGEQMFALACSTCHAVDGTGSPEHVVGFRLPLPNGHDLPDFTDCSTNTVEPLADWSAVVHRGGRVRALDRHMPAFGDALSEEQIDRILQYAALVLPRSLLAARRAEPAARVLHREGLPRKRGGVDHCGHDLGREGRVERGALRASDRRPWAV